jgi:hypothetical protein
MREEIREQRDWQPYRDGRGGRNWRRD